MQRLVIIGLVGLGVGLGLVAGCGSGGADFGQCHGLDLATCRLTDGCKPDTCDLCTCEPQYRGCLGLHQQATACPAVGCLSPDCCSTEAQCAGIGSCAPPGTPFGCGACNPDPSTCTDDASCMAQGASMICDPIPCTCNGATQCTQGCVDDTTCAEGTTCDTASARCVAATCISGPCPPNFACGDVTCFRVTCVDDLDCDGYCVEGLCYAGRGECRQPVP